MELTLNKSSLIEVQGCQMNLLNGESTPYLDIYKERNIVRYYLCEKVEGFDLTPGFLGTPAGMTTMSAPVRTFFKPSSGGR